MIRSLPLSKAALFLDLDGTLAPIAPTPDQVGPIAARTELLRTLSVALEGRLAIVSGRSITDIDRIIEQALVCVGGLHGLERRSAAGDILRPEPHEGLRHATREIHAFISARPPLMAEEKGLSIAVHFRAAPEHGGEVHKFAEALAAATQLSLQAGDHVVELRNPGADKGDAVRAFMAEPPFAGSIPVFVGDDLTDEHGFLAARELGGFGVLVASRRETAATARLSGVDAVLAWLRNGVTAGAFELQES